MVEEYVAGENLDGGCIAVPAPEGLTVDDSPKPMKPRYTVVLHGAEEKEVESARKLTPRTDESDFYAPPRTAVGRERGIYWAPVVENRRITAEDWDQDVRHVEFDISDGAQVGDTAESPFGAGDIAVVYPENVTETDDMLKYLALDGDTVISIHAADGSKQLVLPSPVSLCDLFSKYLAILETPRRSFFERLSLFATNEEEVRSLCFEIDADLVSMLISYSCPCSITKER